MTNDWSMSEKWEWISYLDTPFKLAIFSWLTGFFFGVYLMTGIDITPDSFPFVILNSVLRVLHLTSWILPLEIFSIILTVLGLVYASVSIWKYKLHGIIIFATGFLSALSLISVMKTGGSSLFWLSAVGWLGLGVISLIVAAWTE